MVRHPVGATARVAAHLLLEGRDHLLELFDDPDEFLPVHILGLVPSKKGGMYMTRRRVKVSHEKVPADESIFVVKTTLLIASEAAQPSAARGAPKNKAAPATSRKRPRSSLDREDYLSDSSSSSSSDGAISVSEDEPGELELSDMEPGGTSDAETGDASGDGDPLLKKDGLQCRIQPRDVDRRPPERIQPRIIGTLGDPASIPVEALFFKLFIRSGYMTRMVEDLSKRLLDATQARTSEREFVTFLGLLLRTTLYNRPSGPHGAVSTTALFAPGVGEDGVQNPDFGRFMKKGRFEMLKQFFRLSSIPHDSKIVNPDSERVTWSDGWEHAEPFVEAFNGARHDSFVPGSVLVVDESMSKWRGKDNHYEDGSHRKPEDMGFEIKTIACGQSRVMVGAELVNSKHRPRREREGEVKKGPAWLLRLCKAFLSSGRTVIYDAGFGLVEAVVGGKKRISERKLKRDSSTAEYYEYAGAINQHNRERQGMLGLERSILTHNPDLRLFCTFLGMSVVDTYSATRLFSEKTNFDDFVRLLSWRLINNTLDDGAANQVPNLDSPRSSVSSSSVKHEIVGLLNLNQKFDLGYSPKCPHVRCSDCKGTFVETSDGNVKRARAQQASLVCLRCTYARLGTQPLCKDTRQNLHGVCSKCRDRHYLRPVGLLGPRKDNEEGI